MSATLHSLHQRYHPLIETTLRESLEKRRQAEATADLDAYYGLMYYHLGWADATLAPQITRAGKRFRAILLCLAFEAAGAWNMARTNAVDMAHLHRVLPAAIVIELAHNFPLIHDDIEDADLQRHHRPTLWTIFGVPQAINTGDGMFALSRQILWGLQEAGVEDALVIRLCQVFDRAGQAIAEGQYLNLSFQEHSSVSVPMYLDMIHRKTAALMSCAAAMGAMLGTRDQTAIESLRRFGEALGLAFQLRDDLLGVWASSGELGKTVAGDLFRRKKSLPILHALEYASKPDQYVLRTLYQSKAEMTQEQVDTILEIFERTQTRKYCQAFLAEQCRLASLSLTHVPRSNTPIAQQAREQLGMLVHFVEETPL